MGKNSYTEGKWSIVPINCQKTIQSVRLNLFIVSKYFIRYKIFKQENTDCIGRGKNDTNNRHMHLRTSMHRSELNS